MKKIFTFIFSLVIILVIFFIALKFLGKGNNYNTEPTVSLVGGDTNEALIMDSFLETKSLDQENDYVSFDVRYPYFKQAPNEFNLSIENFVKSQMGEHIKISEENWKGRYENQSSGENIASVPGVDEKFSFFSDFNIIQNNSTYISVVIVYGGYSGGAHGYENKISFNYDLKQSRNVELEDLFKDKTDYLEYLSNETKNILLKEYALIQTDDNNKNEAELEYDSNLVDSINLGTEPDLDNFNTFSFTNTEVTIYFAQYQVGPYVLGMPEVTIGR